MNTDDIARELIKRRRFEPLSFAGTIREVDLVKQLHSMVSDVRAFHEKFGIDYKGKPRVLDFELMQFRLKFLREELVEYEKHADQALFITDQRQLSLENRDAMPSATSSGALHHHLAGMVDALVDLVYVALGTAHLHGFDFEKAWDKVHAANMAKERPAGEARNAEERIKLKMIKPAGWTPPDHLPEVIDNAHIGQKSKP